MGFTRRLALITTPVLLVTLAVMLALSLHSQWEEMRRAETNELAAVSLMLRSSLDRTGAVALAEAQILARQPEIAAAIAAQDRQALVSRLQSSFAYLKAETGVQIFQFHTAALRLLVRIHDPSRFGDDSSSRPMVVAATRQLRGQAGLEIGPTGWLTLRGIAPVLQGEGLAGTAEIGFDLIPILQAVKEATGAEVAVVLSSAVTGGPPRDAQSGDLALHGSTDDTLFKRLFADASISLAKDTVQTDREIDGEFYGVTVQPLLDYSGRMIGGVVTAKDFSAAQRAFRRHALILLFVGFCGLVICHSIILVSVRALVSDPLAALAQYVEGLARGTMAPIPPIGGAAEANKVARAVADLSRKAGAADAGLKDRA